MSYSAPITNPQWRWKAALPVKIASTIGQLTAEGCENRTSEVLRNHAAKNGLGARKAERGSCRVIPRILKMIPAIIGPSNSAAGRCTARKPIERRSDSTHNIPPLQNWHPSLPHYFLFGVSIQHKESWAEEKNNSNQGKGENQQFSERDALSGGKGHHGKSVIVNLKKHHCIEGASLDGGCPEWTKVQPYRFFS